MKKHLFISFILLGSMLFITLVHAGPNENAGIRFDLDSGTYGNQNLVYCPPQSLGTYIRLDVYCTNVHNLDTYEFEILYPSDVLQYISCSATNPLTYEGNILESQGGTAVGWMVDTITPGILSIAYTLTGSDTTKAPEGEGLIADIVFQVIGEQEGTLSFGETRYFANFGEVDVITDKDEVIIEGSVSTDDPGNDPRFKESRLDHYPNPAKNTVMIGYVLKGIAQTSHVEIEIYNSKGQRIDTIQSENGRALWNTKDHPDGIYFYKVKSNENEIVKKMIIMN